MLYNITQLLQELTKYITGGISVLVLLLNIYILLEKICNNKNFSFNLFLEINKNIVIYHLVIYTL